MPEHSAPLLPSFPDARVSAVLIALFEGDDGAEVLLTRRSMHMRNHRGEISFPGGRLDPGETPIETALREAHEEVGLDPRLPSVVGELAHLNTIVSRSYIVPIVSVLDHRPDVEPLTGEVDRVLWTPLAELAQARHLPDGALGQPADGPAAALLRTRRRDRLGRDRPHARRPAHPGDDPRWTSLRYSSRR